MNLWFRLLNMLLRRPWRQSVDPFSTTVVGMRVWPFDLDLNFHVTNGRYLTMADVGRMDYVLKTGAFRTALRHKAVPIVGDVWGKFRRELRLFERFEIHTRMLGWDEKWLFVEHRFMSKGRVVGVVIMRGVFRSAAARCRLSKSCATSACRNSRRHCRNGCSAGPTVATA
ncbi:thioesterase family protein [Pseudoduganella danionis]|uniref:thioesterase family protein n=1 Tax=Pseudoduganella danionis TaxID=1890295 RepID=UPI003623DE80